jgi:endonuclease/exonuclease/phosphatase family metal-dependent hydrolase
VRLATFNVLHGRSPVDDRVDTERFAAAVRELDADVLALQEVDRDQPRSHGADLTAIAARAAGAVAHRFAPALSGDPPQWRRSTGDEPPGTPQYGVALLSRHPVSAWQVVPLPALPGRLPMLFPGRRKPVLVRDEPRIAVVARVEAPEGPLTVASTHLSFLPAWNAVQLRRLARSLPRDLPLVLMGDLNMGTALARRATGLRALAAGLTFPAHAPAEQLDHLLARGVRATSPGRVHRLALSDHCALSVDAAVCSR